MSSLLLYLLSSDDSILEAIQAAIPGAAITALTCLTGVRLARCLDLIIDPRSVGKCCLRILTGWRLRGRRLNVVFLALPAEADLLLRLPQAYPGSVARVDEVSTMLYEGEPTGTRRRAWENRRRILSP